MDQVGVELNRETASCVFSRSPRDHHTISVFNASENMVFLGVVYGLRIFDVVYRT